MSTMAEALSSAGITLYELARLLIGSDCGVAREAIACE